MDPTLICYNGIYRLINQIFRKAQNKKDVKLSNGIFWHQKMSKGLEKTPDVWICKEENVSG